MSSPAMSSPYITKLETVIVGGINYQIRSLSNLQQFYDPEQEAEQTGISSATWPLFGVVWPSGLMLAEIMSTRVIAGLRILELGCGLGIASLIANGRGARITASDYHPLAHEFIDENIRINGMRPIDFSNCDWNRPVTGLGKFDLIIGSDLLYEPDHPGLLSRFIDVHSSPVVNVIIVDPGRCQQAKFRRKMEALGYDPSAVPASKAHMKSHNFKGRITNYSRSHH